MLDQKVAPARALAEKLFDLLLRERINLSPFRDRFGSPDAFARMVELTNSLMIGACHAGLFPYP
jgi:hypothetical protein